MSRALSAWLIVAVATVGLYAQQGTDFSGSWVLEASSASSETIPDRLTVQQESRTLDVTRHFANTVQKKTYSIGAVGGVAGGLPRSETPTTSTDWSVRWVGESLWINERQFTASRLASERSETWRLDDRGRLIITLEIRGSRVVDVQTFFLTYRKEAQ